MKSITQAIFVLAVMPVLVAGCAAERAERKRIKKTESPLVHKKIVIEPFRSYEECIELTSDHIMGYSFRTSRAVDFNIHYHGEERIHYPVSKGEISSWRGTLKVQEMDFTTGEQEYFCLMWENRTDKRVRLEFDCRLQE